MSTTQVVANGGDLRGRLRFARRRSAFVVRACVRSLVVVVLRRCRAAAGARGMRSVVRA